MKQLLITLIVGVLAGGCVSNKMILKTVKETKAELSRLRVQLSKLDSTYNAQQLIKFRHDFQTIDDRYKTIPDADTNLPRHLRKGLI